MKVSASQEVKVKLKNNPSFVYLPHPNVPHEDSTFTSINEVSLSKSHHVIWSEIITCGRKHSGESFKFRHYQNKTKIYIENKLAVLENILSLPFQNNLQAIGQLEDYSHQSSLLFLNNKVDMQLVAGEIIQLLQPEEELCFGISALPTNGLSLRMLANKGEQLYKVHNKIAALIISNLELKRPASLIANSK